MVLGIWVAARYSARVAEAIGLGADNEALSFLATFVLVLLAVHLLARVLTTMIDLVQLELPNKLAGIAFGVLRSVFTVSIVCNLLMGWSSGSMPSREAREGSALFGPVRAAAPLVLPALGETKWVKDVLDQLKEETDQLLDEDGGH
jgi:membrane protein required for colicin V production